MICNGFVTICKKKLAPQIKTGIFDSIRKGMVTMDLRKRIAAAMAAKNMTQADVCREAGISTQLLSKIMVGKTDNPRMDTLVALAKALDVDYNYMFGWEEK